MQQKRFEDFLLFFLNFPFVKKPIILSVDDGFDVFLKKIPFY